MAPSCGSLLAPAGLGEGAEEGRAERSKAQEETAAKTASSVWCGEPPRSLSLRNFAKVDASREPQSVTAGKSDLIVAVQAARTAAMRGERGGSGSGAGCGWDGMWEGGVAAT